MQVGGLIWQPLSETEAAAAPSGKLASIPGFTGPARGRFVAPPPRTAPQLSDDEARHRDQVLRELEELRHRNEQVSAQVRGLGAC